MEINKVPVCINKPKSGFEVFLFGIASVVCIVAWPNALTFLICVVVFGLIVVRDKYLVDLHHRVNYPLDEEFNDLYYNDYRKLHRGKCNRKGAEKHHELMRKYRPEGYSYYGVCQKWYVRKYLDSSFKVFEVPIYDGYGEPLSDMVLVFARVESFFGYK